jgi:hypothetical protein
MKHGYETKIIKQEQTEKTERVPNLRFLDRMNQKAEKSGAEK